MYYQFAILDPRNIPAIGGSPQGVSSRLTIDEVVAVVEKHLR